MKQNFTEAQYVQMARERFCAMLNDIPFVSDIEITLTGLQRGFGDFHAYVHFVDQEEPIRFCVEVKSNGEKRFANLFMKMAGQYNDDGCYVFMAPYISKESAQSLKNGQYSYMDLSGNCYILTRRIFLYVSGQTNKFVVKRERKNYFSKSAGAASAIMRTMLNEPQKQWQVITLAEKSGRAIGTVSNTKSFLRDRDWIKEDGRGFHLVNIKGMLYSWAEDYHKKDERRFEYYSLDVVSELEQKIAEWSDAHDSGAVLGGFSAAVRYAPTVPYKKIDVYVEAQYYNEFVKDLNLQPVSSGGNVIITIPHDETPCMYARKLQGSLITSPVQTVIDLLGNAGRGEEAAEAVILKEYPEDTDDER